MNTNTKYLYWIVPVLAFLPQLIMTLNSFGQMRFEEFIESVQAPFWFDSRLIISGLHVNIGWYAYLLVLYKLFGFSLHAGKISYLVMSLLSNFILAFLLKKFFEYKTAALILITIVLSPTLLFINTLDLHWAMTFHLMIMIIWLLTLLDFSKKRQSLVLTAAIFLLMMICWFFYQAVVFYLPSLIIFYWWKLRKYNLYNYYSSYILTAVVAFLLPLVLLFVWIINKQMLILDSVTGSGLFRGGGQLAFSAEIFSQSWTDFLKDFFQRGVSHHFEVHLADFSLVFPLITLVFMVYLLFKIWKSSPGLKKLILLPVLVIIFDAVIFSTTSDLGLPGMKRVTPILFSIYFLWAICWYHLENFKFQISNFKFIGTVILLIIPIHHLLVYPSNLIHIKDPSPFKVTDWFEQANPQKALSEYVKIAQKQDLQLDCRPIVASLGQCSYDFIYPGVAGSCEWNNLDCHTILGFDRKENKFIPLSIDLLNSHYLE